MTAKALDQELLEQLIIGALGQQPQSAPPTAGASAGTLSTVPPSVLVIAEADNVAREVEAALTGWGGKRATVRNRQAALTQMSTQDFDVVFCSLKQDGSNTAQAISELLAANPDSAIVALIPPAMLEGGAEALHAGATDVVVFPAPPAFLEAKSRKALELARTRMALRKSFTLCRALEREVHPASEWIARGESMRRLSTVAERAAQSDSTVLIQGEAHTGKALLARRIHLLSPRAHGPFVKFDCVFSDEELCAKALFGHDPDQPSFFELAEGGTLYLEEVAALPPGIQERLVRVLQERAVAREGGTRKRPIDVRLICSSIRDLRTEVEEETFRKDLYYRLHVVPVVMPPLRERGEDIAALAQMFAQKAAKKQGTSEPTLTGSVLEALQKHPWPGNLSELELVIQRAIAKSQGADTMPGQPLTLQLAGTTPSIASPTYGTLTETVEALERQLIGEAYEKTRRVKTETARLLGIKTSTLYYKLEKYGFITAGEHEGGPG
jgi:two-component system response regulator HydG